MRTLDTRSTISKESKTNRLDVINEEEGETTEDNNNLSIIAISPLPSVLFIYKDKLLYFIDLFNSRKRLVFIKAFKK